MQITWVYSKTDIVFIKVTQTCFKMFLITFLLFYYTASLCIVNNMLCLLSAFLAVWFSNIFI